MLHWFEIENFLSFRDATRIEMIPGKIVDDFSVFQSPSGQKLNKFCGISGANASGKTNILKALRLVSKFIVDSFKKNDSESTGFEPHFFYKDKQTKIELQFEIIVKDKDTESESSEIYKYEISATVSHVIHEKLSKKTSRNFSRVYERILDGENYIYKGAGTRFTNDMPKNASMISWFARQQLKIAQEIQKYFSSFISSSSLFTVRMPSYVGAYEAIEIYRNKPTIKDRMVEMLLKHDLGIAGIDLVQNKYLDSDGKEETYWEALFSHSVNEQTEKLNIFEQSSGTIEFFNHLAPIYLTLENGGIFLIDEIEDGLHPELINVLLDLFMMPESNPKNAQIIFTTHSMWILDYLNKWQIVLVEKNDCESQAWRVSSMSGIEYRDTLSKLYRSGALGAVPRIN